MLSKDTRSHVINPLTACDFYKVDHRRQYPEGTEMVYSNFTPRSAHHNVIPAPLFNGCVTFFGLQYFIQKFLIEDWNNNFFSRNKEEVVSAYKRRMDSSLGPDSVPVEQIAELHDLGFLPLIIKALPEGTQVPIGVPVLVMHNTDKRFFWITNYLETIMSAYLWKAITSATIAHHYRILLETHAKKTGSDLGFVDFQAHDFSFRGMSGPEDAALSGAAHLTSFKGTDTIIAIDLVEDYYGVFPGEFIGGSIPATEHSVVCMGTKEGEIDTFRRLITQLYPKGLVSLVSDTWDFFKVITEYAAELKPTMMAREGKVVFRPDSGDPVEIICGLPPYTDNNVGAAYANDAIAKTPQGKGAVECLWDIFGGTINEAGFKVLDPHVGLIYGDSITLERAHLILKGLQQKGFASSNVVFGIGSYTYQHVTRDTFGFAVKATYGIVNGEPREIFKCPITDDGTKKSAKGLLSVEMIGGKLTLKDQQPHLNMPNDLMVEVFNNGRLTWHQTFSQIRDRIKSA